MDVPEVDQRSPEVVWYRELIDIASSSFAKATVNILIADGRDPWTAGGCGSGFLIDLGPCTGLVTASHVVELLRDARYVIARISDHASILLQNVAFCCDRTNDIAVAILPDEVFRSRNVSVVPGLRLHSLVHDEPGLDDGVYIALGYPGSKNTVDVRKSFTQNYLLSMTLTRHPNPRLVTAIAQSLALEYKPKRMYTTQGMRIPGVPKLNGISGGPVIQFYPRLARDGSIEPTVSLAGVFVEWHKLTNVVVAAKSSALQQLLHEALMLCGESR